MPTKKRIEKVNSVLARRKGDLRIVLEEVRNAHNASAVVRTCDSAGIQYLDIISEENIPFPVNEAISTRAEKWLQFNTYRTTADCLQTLKEKGFSIAATYLGESSLPYTDVDYTRPTALVFGNEAEGISPAARELADHLIRIPMLGMAQSLNLSVSVGIILYEALRQRATSGTYKNKGLSREETDYFTRKWLITD